MKKENEDVFEEANNTKEKNGMFEESVDAVHTIEGKYNFCS